MDISCVAIPCPVILNATCVFYEGANLVYTGINSGDNLQTALQKIDAKFEDAGLGYVFVNGLIVATIMAYGIFMMTINSDDQSNILRFAAWGNSLINISESPIYGTTNFSSFDNDEILNIFNSYCSF